MGLLLHPSYAFDATARLPVSTDLWVSLATGGLGSVFDPAQTQPCIEAFVRTLLRVDVPGPNARCTAGLSRTMKLTVGSSDLIGRRSSASMRLNDMDLRAQPEVDVSVEALRARPADIADEIVARLIAQVK